MSMSIEHLGHKLVPCGKPDGRLRLITRYGRRTRQADGRLVHQYFCGLRVFNTDGHGWWRVVQEWCTAGSE